MYTPRHFEESDQATLHELIRTYPLATLIVTAGDETIVNHIPLVLHNSADILQLRGHIPRSNPLADAISSATSCVAVFQGPRGYISPSWYATKKIHGKVVPTWNYAVVHCHGSLEAREDSSWILTQLNDLTTQMEAHRSEPWAVSDAPEDYINRAVQSLVGIEMTVTRSEGKFKLSQNQPPENQHSLLTGIQSEPEMSALLMMMEEKLG